MPKRSLLDLCDELIAGIINRVAKAKDLKALSLAHRSFTDLCQLHLFQSLAITSSNDRLPIVYDTVEGDPRKIAHIRKLFVRFGGPDDVFNPLVDPRFLSLMQAMSNAPRRLSELFIANGDDLGAATSGPLLMEHIFTPGICHALTELTVYSTQLPGAAISQCSQLKQLDLSQVRPTEPDTALTHAPGEYKAPGRLPHLTKLDYSSSADMVRRLVNVHGPKPPVASLSELRILNIVPEHQEDMAVAQPILDAAQDSLEELHLVETTDDPRYESRYFILAGLLDFQRLSRLRHFQLRARMCDSDSNRTQVINDMKVMLSRLPPGNSLYTLDYRVQALGQPPFTTALRQSWHGLAKEVIRVSAGRHFRFLFEMNANLEDSEPEDSSSWDDARLHAAHEMLYSHIQHEMRAIKAHKNIQWIFQNEINGYGPWF
ncbi:hypothetical protein BKA70DRAFT_126871 [Coprinopsis sp. MPI-PUGE-AT-0042]|nr:hypothetical protein BKA70DRAFT_126871 [Coprinopsis sp. MPI-PUGE-AT-0042]